MAIKMAEMNFDYFYKALIINDSYPSKDCEQIWGVKMNENKKSNFQVFSGDNI